MALFLGKHPSFSTDTRMVRRGNVSSHSASPTAHGWNGWTERDPRSPFFLALLGRLHCYIPPATNSRPGLQQWRDILTNNRRPGTRIWPNISGPGAVLSAA